MVDAKDFLGQLGRFLATHSVVVLWAGFLITVPLGQLIGHGDFLKSLMGDNYMRDYKRVLEETFELMGYILILAGTVEAAVEMRTPEGCEGPEFDIKQVNLKAAASNSFLHKWN